MSYSCYLGGMEVPTPAKLTVKAKGKNKTLILLNEGEINFLRSPGLTEITVPLRPIGPPLFQVHVHRHVQPLLGVLYDVVVLHAYGQVGVCGPSPPSITGRGRTTPKSPARTRTKSATQI